MKNAVNFSHNLGNTTKKARPYFQEDVCIKKREKKVKVLNRHAKLNKKLISYMATHSHFTPALLENTVNLLNQQIIIKKAQFAHAAKKS